LARRSARAQETIGSGQGAIRDPEREANFMSPGTFDFELGVKVAAPVMATGRVKPGELPATKVARTIYSGPYEGLPSAWGDFDAWMKANNHEKAESLWELYSVGPQSTPDPANWRTELNRPLKT
jgi:effector-binding domain-containing protein